MLMALHGHYPRIRKATFGSGELDTAPWGSDCLTSDASACRNLCPNLPAIPFLFPSFSFSIPHFLSSFVLPFLLRIKKSKCLSCEFSQWLHFKIKRENALFRANISFSVAICSMDHCVWGHWSSQTAEVAMLQPELLTSILPAIMVQHFLRFSCSCSIIHPPLAETFRMPSA